MAEAQESAEPTRGALKSRNVIAPIVRDIAKLISDSDDQWKEFAEVWLELRKLQAGGGVGGGVIEDQTISITNDGSSFVTITGAVVDGQISLNFDWTTTDCDA